MYTPTAPPIRPAIEEKTVVTMKPMMMPTRMAPAHANPANPPGPPDEGGEIRRAIYISKKPIAPDNKKQRISDKYFFILKPIKKLTKKESRTLSQSVINVTTSPTTNLLCCNL